MSSWQRHRSRVSGIDLCAGCVGVAWCSDNQLNNAYDEPSGEVACTIDAQRGSASLMIVSLWAVNLIVMTGHQRYRRVVSCSVMREAMFAYYPSSDSEKLYSQVDSVTCCRGR